MQITSLASAVVAAAAVADDDAVDDADADDDIGVALTGHTEQQTRSLLTDSTVRHVTVSHTGMSHSHRHGGSVQTSKCAYRPHTHAHTHSE